METASFIDLGGEERAATVIFLRCGARYEGRIDADLEPGDRILLLFNDGAAVLHGLGDGVKPKNWMPSGSETERTPDRIIITHKRGEKLEIFVEQIFHEHVCRGTLHGRLTKLGSERELSDLLAKNLDVIERDLLLVGREWRTPVGPIDLLCVAPNGDPVAIEVKRTRVVGSEVIYQILRYLDALATMDEWRGSTPRGILVAPTISRPAKAIALRLDMKFVRVRFEELVTSLPPELDPK